MIQTQTVRTWFQQTEFERCQLIILSYNDNEFWQALDQYISIDKVILVYAHDDPDGSFDVSVYPMTCGFNEAVEVAAAVEYIIETISAHGTVSIQWDNKISPAPQSNYRVYVTAGLQHLIGKETKDSLRWRKLTELKEWLTNH